MISVEHVIDRAGDDGVMPLLTLDECFEGNDDEGCIAPNQWGYGRPPLADLVARLHAVEQRPDVAWVRVQLHPETLALEEITAEAVAVCTTADESARAAWAAELGASGVIPGLVDEYRDVPHAPPGTAVWSVVWD
ncbi:hypothetical protein ACIRD3_11580 [Kitasatospora sp. NPDC093550]|uniref:hypothetical protein n=1 Tax=Kitasatospora sp. NPDC093550 TaxID=3364089 RepID=UPI00381FF504